MDLGLRDKVAVITGGSRGIGRAVALALAEEGCRLAIAARDEAALTETSAEVETKGTTALAVPGDLPAAGSCERLVQAAADAFGRIDILVNSVHASVPGEDEAVFRRALESLFFIAVRCTDLVVPHLRRQGGGVIVHLSSIWGREAGGHPAYNAAKAALISHARAMATVLAPDNIRVLTVAPGSISHPGGTWWRRQQEDPEGMARFVKENIPIGRFGTAEEVANVVVFLCSPRASWVTGSTVVVDGGQSRSNI
ncbi:MAG: SDR family oxidoreductase [Chloroflexi bacterium]|nr:SDR family oxidoreductase [Chloroflexota bacterium]